MRRRKSISRWGYGLLFFLACVILLNFTLATGNFLAGRWLPGARAVLSVVALLFLAFLNLFEIESRSRLILYLSYGIAALGVASLIATWMSR